MVTLYKKTVGSLDKVSVVNWKQTKISLLNITPCYTAVNSQIGAQPLGWDTHDFKNYKGYTLTSYNHNFNSVLKSSPF